jgi:hypothetical protein
MMYLRQYRKARSPRWRYKSSKVEVRTPDPLGRTCHEVPQRVHPHDHRDQGERRRDDVARIKRPSHSTSNEVRDPNGSGHHEHVSVHTGSK